MNLGSVKLIVTLLSAVATIALSIWGWKSIAANIAEKSEVVENLRTENKKLTRLNDAQGEQIKSAYRALSVANKNVDSLKQDLEIKSTKLNGLTLKLNRTQSKLDTIIKYNRVCFERIVTYERKGLKKIRNERIVEIACPN